MNDEKLGKAVEIKKDVSVVAHVHGVGLRRTEVTKRTVLFPQKKTAEELAAEAKLISWE